MINIYYLTKIPFSHQQSHHMPHGGSSLTSTEPVLFIPILLYIKHTGMRSSARTQNPPATMGFKSLSIFAILLSGFASAAQLDATQFKLTESGYNANIAKLDAILPIVTVSAVRFFSP